MYIDTITEAKAQLSKLIELAQSGEEIIIARAGKPAAMLVPYEKSQSPRRPGSLKGKIEISDDFDELPDDIAAGFGLIDE